MADTSKPFLERYLGVMVSIIGVILVPLLGMTMSVQTRLAILERSASDSDRLGEKVEAINTSIAQLQAKVDLILMLQQAPPPKKNDG